MRGPLRGAPLLAAQCDARARELSMKIASSSLAAIVAVAILGQLPAHADADDSFAQEVQATAYRAIPPGTAFRVELADRSGLTHHVAQLLQTELPDAGYALSAQSPFVLTVATEVTEPNGRSPLPLELRATKGSVGMRLFLLGRNSSGVLQQDPEATAGEYRVVLTIHDRRHPQGYLWRARATACQCGLGATAAWHDMVPALVKTIGRNAGAQPVAPKAARLPSPKGTALATPNP
jgi:hypothetical protein